jgi:hypothetical protein
MGLIAEFPGGGKASMPEPESLFKQPEVLATREEWLIRALDRVRPLFLEKDIVLPPQVRLACGWPYCAGRGQGSSHTIGQCWARRASKDGTSEVFISPALDDGVAVTEVLCHELIHCVDDCRHGHRGPFGKMALAIGLEGPMRSTHAGPELRERLNALCVELGPYPHARLDPTQVVKKQSTRLIKVVCRRAPNECYAFWTTRLHLDKGTPTCVCGSRMNEVTRQ